jgi:hypothetical protein
MEWNAMKWNEMEWNSNAKVMQKWLDERVIMLRVKSLYYSKV